MSETCTLLRRPYVTIQQWTRETGSNCIAAQKTDAKNLNVVELRKCLS